MKTLQVGDFELGEHLASGTVGDVYHARHRATGQRAVVKFLQSHAESEPDLQRRFVREVAILERLNHPNIVRHYDCGLAEDRIYFAMELVDSGTLREVLRKRGKLPWREAAECAMQICAALAHAHSIGVIHRDLKPANLFLADDGQVKVGDFGLARDMNNTRLTMDGQTVGTCRYMPPEQIAGEAELSGATDLYALGCILYEMITGTTPFDGGTIVEIFESHLNDFPEPPAELVRDCPADLSKLVMLLLEKSTADRPHDAVAVQSALADILHGRPMQLSARGADELAADLAATIHPDRPNLTQRLHAEDQPAPWKRGWLAWAALGLVAGILLLAVIAARLF
ncbi:MAG: serine/threonine protein kinase [Pirellulales bacterium]